MKEEILPSERKIFNSIIEMAFKKNDELEKINKEQALEIAKLKENKPIEYDRLFKIARKMHLWIFLHSGNEQADYDELGLTDEENNLLGYSGKLCIPIEDKDNKIHNLLKEVDNNVN